VDCLSSTVLGRLYHFQQDYYWNTASVAYSVKAKEVCAGMVSYTAVLRLCNLSVFSTTSV